MGRKWRTARGVMAGGPGRGGPGRGSLPARVTTRVLGLPRGCAALPSRCFRYSPEPPELDEPPVPEFDEPPEPDLDVLPEPVPELAEPPVPLDEPEPARLEPPLELEDDELFDDELFDDEDEPVFVPSAEEFVDTELVPEFEPLLAATVEPGIVSAGAPALESVDFEFEPQAARVSPAMIAVAPAAIVRGRGARSITRATADGRWRSSLESSVRNVILRIC